MILAARALDSRALRLEDCGEAFRGGFGGVIGVFRGFDARGEGRLCGVEALGA